MIIIQNEEYFYQPLLYLLQNMHYIINILLQEERGHRHSQRMGCKKTAQFYVINFVSVINEYFIAAQFVSGFVDVLCHQLK